MRIETWSAGETRGFTLVEVLVVLVILSLAAVTVLPSLQRGLEVSRFRAQVRELAQQLTQTRIAAIRDNHTKQQLWSRTPEGGGADPLPQSLHIQSAKDARPLDQLRVLFFPDGSASALDVRVASAGQVAALRVDPISGAVRVELGSEVRP